MRDTDPFDVIVAIPITVNKWKMWFKIIALLLFKDIISHVK